MRIPTGVLLAINVGLKVALLALLALAVTRPDLPQFAGKAMGGRALTYPLAALLVPAVWLATCGGKNAIITIGPVLLTLRRRRESNPR